MRDGSKEHGRQRYHVAGSDGNARAIGNGQPGTRRDGAAALAAAAAVALTAAAVVALAACTGVGAPGATATLAEAERSWAVHSTEEPAARRDHIERAQHVGGVRRVVVGVGVVAAFHLEQEARELALVQRQRRCQVGTHKHKEGERRERPPICRVRQLKRVKAPLVRRAQRCHHAVARRTQQQQRKRRAHALLRRRSYAVGRLVRRRLQRRLQRNAVYAVEPARAARRQRRLVVQTARVWAR
mmetsp:Transcript_3086/g.8522  ORF Transcript_3086/g.8522 Transcript_3086/m.8522 type:complete len:242 (-) Transcript_3086:1474-2199(-)